MFNASSQSPSVVARSIHAAVNINRWRLTTSPSDSFYFATRLLIAFFCSLFLYGCSTPHYQILGTTYGYSNPQKLELTVLLDARVGNLRVRHVRRKHSQCNSGYIEHLELDGAIGPDSTAAMEKLLNRVARCQTDSAGNWLSTTVYLNSGGGLLRDGFRLGKLFREHQVHTIITGGQRCSSSCAIAFLGGYWRQMAADAQLLFHAPYVHLDQRSIDCSDSGQVGELKKYYVSVLNQSDGEFLHQRTMDYCSVSSGWSLNRDAADLFNITNARG